MSHKITLNKNRVKGKINKNIYGHFSEHLGRCIYQGIFVGKDSKIPNINGIRSDIVKAMKNINLPVLRWPGGCFADEYHWEDGIGPAENRKRMVNSHWGGVVEDNSFGTHEFLDLCDQVGCEPYINANLGSGTVKEMSEWVEYLNSDGDSTIARKRWENGRKEPFAVKYWGVGNENWGCGGNMRPEYYADEYRRYQTYCRNYGKNRLYRIACGPNGGDYSWTEAFMKSAAPYCDAITLHHYTVPMDWANKGSATSFTKEVYYNTLEKALYMETLVSNHLQIMNQYDKEHRVGLIVDEWGTWYDVEEGTNPGFLYQQNTMRDAIVAALTLNIFNRHCDRVVMANIAQTVNVLQAIILTEGEKMVLTPTYHIFDLYQAHQDANCIDCFVETANIGQDEKVPVISASSSEKGGAITLTIANTSVDSNEKVYLKGLSFVQKQITGRILCEKMDAYNDFDHSPVGIKPFNGFTIMDGKMEISMPPCSVLELILT